MALKHFALVAEMDVAIVQVGDMDSKVTALQANRFQAGILSYPAIARAKRDQNTTLKIMGKICARPIPTRSANGRVSHPHR